MKKKLLKRILKLNFHEAILLYLNFIGGETTLMCQLKFFSIQFFSFHYSLKTNIFQRAVKKKPLGRIEKTWIAISV